MSIYAWRVGFRETRDVLAAWRSEPWPVLRLWGICSVAGALLLLVGVWVIAALSPAPTEFPFIRPPLDQRLGQRQQPDVHRERDLPGPWPRASVDHAPRPQRR